MKEREFNRKKARPHWGLAFPFLVAFFALAFGVPRNVDAQWKDILRTTTARVNVIYFLDQAGFKNIGFAATNLGYLYKTTDCGSNWKLVFQSYPDVQYLTDIVFKDADTGWMLSQEEFDSGTGGCLKTTDGGLTWNFIDLPTYPCSSIYYDHKTGGLFISAWDYANQIVSLDEGATWAMADNPYTTEASNGYSFFNDDTGILTGVTFGGREPGTNWVRTFDGGKTWQRIAMDSESWQPLAISGSQTGYAVMDIGGGVARTNDLWNTWTIRYTFPPIKDSNGFVSSGCIRGDSCHLFAQVATGCYMSTDQGNNWSVIGSLPTAQVYDCRFFADDDKLVMGTFNWANPGGNPDTGFSDLWMLPLDSLNPTIGISSRFDNGTQRTTLHPGDSIGVTFVPGAGTLAATDSVTLTLRYDPNAVDVRGTSLQVPAGWWISDSSTTCTPPPLQEEGAGGWCSLRLTLRSASAESLPNPLLHAEFHTYLTPSESRAGTPAPRAFIYLDNAQSFFPQTTPCAPTALSMQQPDSVEIDFTGCGNQTILDVMEGQPPFRIESIVPNPASTSISVTVSGNRGPGSGIECQLFDALGNLVLRQPLDHPPAPSYSTPFHRRGSLDVSGLPSGIYFLRLSSSGYAVSRSVSIEH